MTAWQQYAAGAQLMHDLYGDPLPRPSRPSPPSRPANVHDDGSRAYSRAEAERVLASARRTVTEQRIRAIAERVNRLERPTPPPAPDPDPAPEVTVDTGPPVDALWLIRRWRAEGWTS